MIDDMKTLETSKDQVHGIHQQLLSAALTSQTEGLSTMKQLTKEVLEYRKGLTKISRTNQITKKYNKIKRKAIGECPILPKRPRPVQRDDPLQAAAHASVGRPKCKKNIAAAGISHSLN